MERFDWKTMTTALASYKRLELSEWEGNTAEIISHNLIILMKIAATQIRIGFIFYSLRLANIKREIFEEKKYNLKKKHGL